MEKACFLHLVPGPSPSPATRPHGCLPRRGWRIPSAVSRKKDRPRPGGAPPAGRPYQGACHAQRVRLRPCIQHRPERGAPASVPATAGHPQAQDLHRPDVGQGLPPSPVRRPVGPATSSASRASIAWAAIMRKYSGNGGCPRRNCMWTSLYWTCRCWIPGETGTCWGPSLPNSCCRCSRSWPRTSGKTSGGARRKASRRHVCGAYVLDGNQDPCLPISPKCMNCGKRESSPQ